MANHLNQVTIEGNMTRDPEIRFTPSGQAVCSFSIAVNRSWKNRQTNEWEEAVAFVNVVAWAQLGENVSESMTKGTRVVVSGRLDQRSWEKDGQKHSVLEVVANQVSAALSNATVHVTKNERREPGTTTSAPAPSAPPAGYDEEPF